MRSGGGCSGWSSGSRPIPSLPAPLKEATSKWRGLLARLSLVFHCIELAEAKHAGQRPDPITMRTLKPATVEKACNFIMRIVVPSTFRFHTEIGSASASESHGASVRENFAGICGPCHRAKTAAEALAARKQQ